MDTIESIIQDLVALLGNTNLSQDLATVESLAIQLLAALGDKNAQRDLQSQDAYNAALLGSVTAAQYLYHNSLPTSGMPHQDIVDGQFYWAKLLAAGWTVNAGGTVSAPAKTPPVAAVMSFATRSTTPGSDQYRR
jgi:hypothetical protein